MRIEPRLPSADPFVLTMTELRVLSGLSRGAAMPLDESITIGSDFACDLLLVDPGINEKHATLVRDGSGRYLLSILQPGAAAGPGHVVEPGVAFKLADIRMLICESDAEWDFSLPVPVPPPLSAIEAAVADGVAAGRLGPGAAIPPKAREPLNVKRIVTVSGVIAVLALLIFAVFLHGDAEPEPPVATPAVVPRVYSEAEVQAIAASFASRLDNLNIPALKLVTAPQQLTIQGLLDRSAESRFEGAVQELRGSHPGLKVRLDLGGEAASVLPFEITAAVGGSNGSVLLADGQQLFVGAEEAGFKFLGLIGNCLNFLQVATQQKVSQCSDPNPRRR